MNARGGYKLVCVERGCLKESCKARPCSAPAQTAADARARRDGHASLTQARSRCSEARRQMIIPIRCFTCGKVRALPPRAAVPRLFPRLTAPPLLPPWFRR